MALTFPESLTRLLQALGGILMLYFTFGIISNIIAFRRNKKINKVIDAVHEIGKDVEGIKKMLKKKL